MVPIAATSGGQSIIYDPGVNVDLSSGLTYPTAVDQTVTLLFAQPLAPGSYEIELSPAIQAAAFNAAEAGELAPGDGSFAGHPVVTVTGALVVNGAGLYRARAGDGPRRRDRPEVGRRPLAVPDPAPGRPRRGARPGAPGRPSATRPSRRP